LLKTTNQSRTAPSNKTKQGGCLTGAGLIDAAKPFLVLELGNGKRFLLAVTLLSLTLGFGVLSLNAGAANAKGVELPPESLRTPPLAKENSVSTYVPSETCEGQGLAVNLIYGEKARYEEGAPVVVVIPGGEGADGLSFNTHMAQVGLIEVRFAFPGGGSAKFGSKGTFDNRGALSIEALRDVLLFAGGKKPDYKGRFISDLTKQSGAPRPLSDNIGILGWDNGGNQALVALAKFPEDLGFITWLAFYESPIGSMFHPSNLGSQQDLMINKHYREGSASSGNLVVDYRKLRWLPQGFRRPNRLTGTKRGTPGLKGVLFFDENENGQWEESKEFAFNSSLDVALTKQFFPPQVAAACERLDVFKGAWPANVGTVSESEEFFANRDGSLYVSQVAAKYPKLMVGIFASSVDHNQQQIDHPHITFLYNSFLTNKVKWLRLNPDPVYVAAIAAMNLANFVNNRPNTSIDTTTDQGALLAHLEPEGIVPDYVYMQAFAAEMSDRFKLKKFRELLKAPLVNYSNGAQDAPKPE